MNKKKNEAASKIMTGLQSFQPAIMPAIAIIPLGGLLMGLGAFLTNATFVEMYPILGNPVISTIAWMLRNSGQFVLNNIGFMFAISIAMVYSGYEGFSALSAGISYIVFMKGVGTILGITAATVPENMATQTTVLGIPTLNTGVMGGIAVGLLVAWCYKKFHNTKLPLALAFFQGKRTVPIMSICCSMLLAFVFSLVWPLIQSGLQASIGGLVNSENLLAMCIMLFISRLLVPFGLHALLNTPLNYEFGTYVTKSGESVHGAVNIYMSQLADGGNWSDIAFYNAGGAFSILFMIVIAFVIIASAKKEYRKRTLGLFSGGIVTAFLTGISEPILFSYLFTCPPLFVLNCLFHGFSPYFAKMANMYVGTGFAGGLMDFIVYGILQGNAVTHWTRAFIFYPIFGAFCFVVCFFFIKVFNLHVPGNRDGDFSDDDEDVDVEYKLAGNLKLATKIISNLKGKDNIISVDSCATRLRITVKDVAGINKDSFNKLGAKGTMIAGNNLQIIFGLEAPRIKDEVKAVLTGNTIIAVSNKTEIKEEVAVPATGKLIPLSEVKDETLASGLIGQGFAVEPTDGLVHSPVNGTIESIFPTKHAIAIKTDTGKDVLLHLGIDTVKLEGKPFTLCVKVGDLVSAGTELGTMDIAMVKAAGCEATVCVLFIDLKDETVKLTKTGNVRAKELGFVDFVKY